MAKPSPFKYRSADASAGFLLWKVTALWQRKLAEVLGDFGITQTHYAILASLRWFEEKGEPPTQAHLVEHTRIDKMTLSKAIRKLEGGGLIAREQSSDDSRATNVRFTTKGRRVIHQAIQAVENADEDFFSVLAKRELDTYKSFMAKIIAGNIIGEERVN